DAPRVARESRTLDLAVLHLVRGRRPEAVLDTDVRVRADDAPALADVLDRRARAKLQGRHELRVPVRQRLTFEEKGFASERQLAAYDDSRVRQRVHVHPHLDGR